MSENRFSQEEQDFIKEISQIKAQLADIPRIYASVGRLEAEVSKLGLAIGDINARKDERWKAYDKESERMQKEINGTILEVKNNTINVARMLALGGGGGVITVALIEIVKAIMNKP